ncbi:MULTISPECIES: DUF1284 domain-containing protein [Nitratireductor]|uniref:DUF1284 domain-containing protein n=1 Tax=Nitratireductor TaxID=245876 RepID=UPI000D0D651C|nr:MULTISPECIES: DUF1284 domain-containing protein [Nitratireductor]PSM17844.1 DUF1284 domain-containing protein [Nitratireductor sp. StC3]
MTVRLRPHHLLCVLTYAGKGYSPAFTANMTAIAGRLAGGEDVEVVAGPDDVCAPLLSDPQPHCHRASVSERDRAAIDDLGRVLALPVRLGGRLRLDATWLGRLRAAFAAGHVRSACHECEWDALCTAIAQDGFAHTVLAARAREA